MRIRFRIEADCRSLGIGGRNQTGKIHKTMFGRVIPADSSRTTPPPSVPPPHTSLQINAFPFPSPPLKKAGKPRPLRLPLLFFNSQFLIPYSSPGLSSSPPDPPEAAGSSVKRSPFTVCVRLRNKLPGRKQRRGLRSCEAEKSSTVTLPELPNRN